MAKETLIQEPEIVEGELQEKDFTRVWADQEKELRTQDIAEGTPERSTAVREDLDKIVSLGGTLSLVCCQLLYETMEHNYWTVWTYEEDGLPKNYISFEDFAFRQLKMERRKAYYLAEFYRKYVIEAKVPPEVVATLPYSKAILCKDLVTESNWKDVVDKINTTPTDSLKPWVAEQKGSPEDAKVHKLIMNFTDAQWENWQTAYNIASTDTNSTDRGQIMDFIFTDFIAGQLDEPGGRDALLRLDRIVQALERTFKVKFLPPEPLDLEMYKDVIEYEEVLDPGEINEDPTPTDVFGPDAGENLFEEQV